MSLMLPALQKFYSALKQLMQFSIENDFYDNVSCIDTFLTEYRSVTFALQKSLGRNDDPVYIKNRDFYLKGDKVLSDWLIDQRNIVDHEHPFSLKKVLRVVIYDFGNAVVFRQYEQKIDKDEPLGDYLQAIKDTFKSIQIPEINFSAQLLFVNDEDASEKSIFDFIERGVLVMWQFLHAMKADIKDESEVANDIMGRIDSLFHRMSKRWIIDALDYCYYQSNDTFERGSSLTMALPEIRMPKELFVLQVKNLTSTIDNFYDAFIYFHTYAYIEQQHHILSTFYIEFNDETFQVIAFSASIRTTMYRYVNRVANLVEEGNVANVYLVAETVGYGVDLMNNPGFLRLNYEEKKAFRNKTFLTFYKVSSSGEIIPVMMDADDLVDRLSVSAVMSKVKAANQPDQFSVMLSPIMRAFRKTQANRK